jgi:putative ABC transport system substrate-binding protein
VESRNRTPRAKALELVKCKTKGAGTTSQPLVIAGKNDGLSLAAEKFHRSQMKSVQSSNWLGKRFQRSNEHGWSHLDEREATQQRARFVGVRSRQFARVNPSPDLILDEPAGDERLLPESFRRLAVFRQEMSEGNRGVEINQRSLRSCSISFSSLRKDITGLRGGGPDAASAGGVIQPLRTASESRASASTGLLVLSGGTSSATTRSRSVTNTVSPCSARRTYSLSLFFRTFKPTAFTSTNVAPGSYFCQGPRFCCGAGVRPSGGASGEASGVSKTIWDEGTRRMVEIIGRLFGFHSDNRKSAIQNPRWLGLSVIAFVIVVGGAVVEAQHPGKVPRIGYLTAASLSAIPARIEAFRQGLRELGYVEAKNIVVEWRSPEGKSDHLPALAAELVRLKVDVIVTGGAGATRPAKEATSTIPIVMAQDTDPVGNGFVASLARPGGNITGLATFYPELSGKRLEILKEIIPRLSIVAVLTTSTSQASRQSLKETELAAGALGVKLQYLDVVDLKDIETAFRTAGKRRADAVLVMVEGPATNSHRKEFADLAANSRLPAIYSRREYVEAGALMSYGVSIDDMDRRAATYVDKILRGAKPADLPVEQPKKLEFIINLKAANQIGLTIPASVLARADKVIK